MDHRILSIRDADAISVHNHQLFAAMKMPDLGLEVEEFRAYTWHVQKWSQRGNMIRSPRFKCGGYNWRILLFPSGNPRRNDASPVEYVSIYLECDDRALPKGWHACVQFMLVLSNATDSTIRTVHHAYHRLCYNEPDWGFAKFVALRNLISRQPGERRATIESEQVDVSAFVRVVRDPTGSLWLEPEAV